MPGAKWTATDARHKAWMDGRRSNIFQRDGRTAVKEAETGQADGFPASPHHNPGSEGGDTGGDTEPDNEENPAAIAGRFGRTALGNKKKGVGRRRKRRRRGKVKRGKGGRGKVQDITKSDRTDFTILHSNIQGCVSKQTSVEDIIQRKAPDVYYLNETTWKGK